MQKYTDVVTSARSGAAIPSARVTVKTHPGAVVATIYSDDGVTTKTNPLTTDSNGEFSFYAADGDYTLTVSGTGITERTIGPITLLDPGDADDTTLLATDVSFTPSGSGASDRTVEAKLREYRTPYDFGAVGDGVTDDRTAISNWNAAGGLSLLTAGTFRIGSSLSLGDVGQGDHAIIPAGGKFKADSGATLTINTPIMPTGDYWDTDSEGTLAFGAHGYVRWYGTDRGDGTRYLTHINSPNAGNMGIFTNGHITINGDTGDPVPTAIAGESSYMLGVRSDVASNPVIVVKTVTGPFLRLYDNSNTLLGHISATAVVTMPTFAATTSVTSPLVTITAASSNGAVSYGASVAQGGSGAGTGGGIKLGYGTTDGTYAGIAGRFDNPGVYLSFLTTADNVSAPTEKAFITGTGALVVGATDTNVSEADIRCLGVLWIGDAVTAPTATSFHAAIYVDSADGDLKVKFADGVTKTLATDT